MDIDYTAELENFLSEDTDELDELDELDKFDKLDKSEEPNDLDDLNYLDDLDDFNEFENNEPVIAEMAVNHVYRNTAIEDLPMYEDFETEAKERVRIQNMSDEETMKYLAQSLNEINAPLDLPPALYEQNTDPDDVALNDVLSADTPNKQADEITDLLSVAKQPNHTEVADKYAKLTVEPVWGDIYIKASRSLRELCEEGKLSMHVMEAELKARLLSTAEQFMAVSADKSKVPKVLIPKITELRVATNNFDPYFQAGEDIAVRAMFFMMFQMLSYSDRIAETPETKENLNDFFRKFGSAGIILSMLDMRI